MNYFNYFTEIEDEFVRRRGRHLIVSPLDWALMEVWKERGIPLNIVLRAINNTFDAWEKKDHHGRKINSLIYCRQEVESCHQQYLEAHVGAGDTGRGSAETGSSQEAAGEGQFTPDSVIRYLKEQSASIEELATEAAPGSGRHESLTRAVERLREVTGSLHELTRISWEGLEADLTLIENRILDGLRADLDPGTLTEWESEGKKQLKSYRETMKPEVYQQTLDNFIARRLREWYRVPRLSLFYLNP